MLHCVSDSIKSGYLENWNITKSSFLHLLDYLEANQYQTTHFCRIAEKTNATEKSSRKVILTFDDCYKHLFEFAIPELLRRGMTAAFYMPTAYIGSYNYWDIRKGAKKLAIMDADDLKNLSMQGMEIGSHSHNHAELNNITDVFQLREEIFTSKKILEDILEKPIYSFSYPYGFVPASYKQLLGEAGYKFGVSIYYPFESRLALRRFGLYNKDTDSSLALKLSKPYKWMRSIYDPIKKY